ncbi:MAG: glycoside hydrolase family 15 protein [Rhodomicrobium sp.]
MHGENNQTPAAPSIGDYAIIGDCRTAALVSGAGSIDWLCLPNFSSTSVFAKLLDPRGGSFSLHPTAAFTSTRTYVSGTAVLETMFETENGSARVFDCLPVLDGIKQLRPLREILRIVEGQTGTISFRASIDPRPNYARLEPKPKRAGRLGWSFSWHNEVLHVQTDIDLVPEASLLQGTFSVTAGQRRYLSLSYCLSEPAVIPPLRPEADERLNNTIAWWKGWSAQLEYEGPYKHAVVRSAVTLKLLSSSTSGAIIAAPTTSLPETIGGERNWDYRYCWLRDAGLTMQAMIGLGVKEDAGAFLHWLLHATRLTWPKLKIMYDIYGRTNLHERELAHLAGYRESRPVRIGNGAHRQQQTDVYGEVILAAYSYAAAGGVIDRAGARMLAGLGEVVHGIWREPDSGIWEMRGAPRQFTFSKVMCWTALDRLIALNEIGAVRLGDKAATYKADRTAIAQVIEARGFNNAIKAYTGELDGDTVDASLLLMSSVGYKKASDPRIKSTYALICERLGKSGLLQRYEPGVDGLKGDEGAFGICSFWALEQLAQRGEVALAEEQFAHLLSFGNDVGLFAEEIEESSGQALGNFPQAFTHVGVINVALAIERARVRCSRKEE